MYIGWVPHEKILHHFFKLYEFLKIYFIIFQKEVNINLNQEKLFKLNVYLMQHLSDSTGNMSWETEQDA